MEIEIKSIHFDKENIRKGFEKIKKRFRETKECKEFEKDGCQKIVIDFIEGNLICISSDGIEYVLPGLIKERKYI